MKLGQLAQEVNNLIEEHGGDIDILDTEYFSIVCISVNVAEKDEFPKEWNLPEGKKYAQIESVK